MEDAVTAPNLFKLEAELQTIRFDDGEVEELYFSPTAQTDFDMTGQIVWPAARTLAQYILDHSEHVRNRRVIELGAGPGLAGIVAARFAQEVVVTDYVDEVVALLEKNVSTRKNIVAAKLDWSESTEYNSPNKDAFQNGFDVVLGSDVVFWPDSLLPLVATLKMILLGKTGAIGFIAFVDRVSSVTAAFYHRLRENGITAVTLHRPSQKKADYANEVHLLMLSMAPQA